MNQKGSKPKLATIMQYDREGYNRFLKVYSYTFMPSMIASTIFKPLLFGMEIPYLDNHMMEDYDRVEKTL